MKTAKVQSQILQTQMHSKSRKSASNFEDKRRHSMERSRRWWLTTNLLILKSKHRRRLVWAAVAKRTKKPQQSNTRQIVTHGLLFQVCENPDIISQNWPHYDLIWNLICKSQKDQPKTTIHAPPCAATSFRYRGLLLTICTKLVIIS